MLNIDRNNDAAWDLVSLGEILLRFDPGNKRIDNARSFRVYDGGAEYNVARNLAKVFRLKTVIITALADSSVGRLAEDFAHQGHVDTSKIIWRDQADFRNGLYFIERGFGLRAPNSSFDRSNTAISLLRKGDIDWENIFSKGVRWFHTGGVFAGLSETSRQVALEAVEIAKSHEAIVSYDLNYRDSLWKDRGGKSAANEINLRILPFVDVVFGAVDFDSSLSGFDENVFSESAHKMVERSPNLKIVASTLRDVHSASRHNFSAVCFADGKIFKAKGYENIEVLDRVGSGDAFASGFIYAILSGKDAQHAVDYGVAHGALAMTTVGDNSTATLGEIESLMNNKGANVRR